MVKEKICQFKMIKVNVPQKFLIKCFHHKGYLSQEKSHKIGQKLKEIEQALLRLNHLRSIVDIIWLKCQEKKGD